MPKPRDAYRRENPDEFIRAAMDTESDKPMRGFKLMLQQHPDYMHDLIDDPACLKIFLHRQNVLAQFSPEKTAEAAARGMCRGPER